MIKKKTVFVLGAGASMPYGFESGSEMLMRTKMMGPDAIAGAVGILPASPVSANFARAVKAAQNESLDAFLEHRKESDSELYVGKRLIARRLLLQELNSIYKFDVNGDWIQNLYSRMVYNVKSVNEFQKQNAVTFITYNYDRLLEHRIAYGLQAQFNAPLDQCAGVFDDIKVIHLHGSLGRPFAAGADGTGVVPFGVDAKNNEEFGKQISFFLDLASHSIQIVHQASPKTPEFKAAREVLSEGEQVFYLGFGFGQTNVERLDLRHVKKDAQIYMTRKGMTDQEFPTPPRSAQRRRPLAYHRAPTTLPAGRTTAAEFLSRQGARPWFSRCSANRQSHCPRAATPGT
jgi:hypothetical protein